MAKGQVVWVWEYPYGHRLNTHLLRKNLHPKSPLWTQPLWTSFWDFLGGYVGNFLKFCEWVLGFLHPCAEQIMDVKIIPRSKTVSGQLNMWYNNWGMKVQWGRGKSERQPHLKMVMCHQNKQSNWGEHIKGFEFILWMPRSKTSLKIPSELLAWGHNCFDGADRVHPNLDVN
jgi:hypothetical protein